MSKSFPKLKNPPKLSDYTVLERGSKDQIRFEFRLNARMGDQSISRSFFAFQSGNHPFMAILDIAEVPGLNQRLYKVFTEGGFDVRIGPDSDTAFADICHQTLSQYIENPDDFVPIIDNDDSHILPTLVDYPHIDDSKIVETGSMAGYRYELHTECVSDVSLLHALFVYTPHEADPCMAFTIEDNKSSVFRMLTAKKDKILGRRIDLRPLGAFQNEALSELRAFLNPTDEDGSVIKMPELLESEIIETGHLGVFRCELHTDCYSDSSVKYIHIFYFYVGDSTQAKIAFSLEKPPRAPRPVMVLTYGNERTEFGYDPELLDPKVFRDRAISLAKLALNKAELNEVDIPPAAIESLLKVDSAYTLSACVLVIYGLTWAALNTYSLNEIPVADDLTTGFQAMVGLLYLFLHLKLLRHMGVGLFQRFVRTALLVVPTLNLLIAGLSFLQARQKMRSFGLKVGIGGLSLDETRMMEAKLAASKTPRAKLIP